MAKVAFIGLGVMGFPMAGHLAKRGGHEVTVYNRSPAKAEKWVATHGGRAAPTPRQAAEGAEFVFSEGEFLSVYLHNVGAVGSCEHHFANMPVEEIVFDGHPD